MNVLGVLADLRPLREHATFRRLWIGVTASGFGTQLSAFAVTYYVWDTTRDPVMVGLTGLFTAVPLILVTLLGTAFADHVDRRRLAAAGTCCLLLTSLGMAAVAFAFPASTGGGTTPGVWAMLVLTGVQAALSSLVTPARRSLVPRLLPAGRLAAGLALNHLAFQLALLLGPGVGGVITAEWGVTACFVIDAVTFVAALVGIAGLPAAGPAEGTGHAGAAAVWEGVRFAARTPAVRGTFLSDLCATVLAMPIALFPMINEERFGGSPAVLGLLTSAIAAVASSPPPCPARSPATTAPAASTSPASPCGVRPSLPWASCTRSPPMSASGTPSRPAWGSGSPMTWASGSPPRSGCW